MKNLMGETQFYGAFIIYIEMQIDIITEFE